MKLEIVQRFIAALRSGNYKQTRGALHKDGCFCALGVLADLAIREDGITCWRHEPSLGTMVPNPQSGNPYTGYNGTYGISTLIEQWAGVDNEEGFQIVRMNDGRGLSFEEIANELEQKYGVCRLEV